MSRGERVLKMVFKLSLVHIHTNISLTVAVRSCPDRVGCQSCVPKSVHEVWRLSKASHAVCLQMFSKMGERINSSEARNKEDEVSVPNSAA